MLKLLHTRTLLMLGLLVFGFSVVAPMVNAPQVSADAKSFCKQKDNKVKQACTEGYNAGKQGKNTPCKSKNGSQKTACSLGFEKGKKDKGGKGGKAGSGTTSGDSSYAQGASDGACNKGFFGLVPWYKYIRGEFKFTDPKLQELNDGTPCEIKCFNVFPTPSANDCGQRGSDIPYVLLAVVDNLLRIAGLVAVAFVLVGSIRYITSQGNPEDAASAQSTLINALIGLAVAMVAVAFISFIGSRLG